MPRLREVPLKDADPFARDLYGFIFGDRDPVEKPGTDTGTPGNWWTVFALVPDVLKHAVKGFSLYRDPSRKLNPQLRELSQTRRYLVKRLARLYRPARSYPWGRACGGTAAMERKTHF